MRAIHVEKPGGPEALQLTDLPTPRPGPGQALVRVEAAGVNFIDIYQRLGQYPMELPFTPGMEGAGVIEELGAPGPTGAHGLKAGARVAWASGAGAYAAQVVVAVERLVPVPDEISSQTAAAVMLQGMTAHYLVNDTFPLRRGAGGASRQQTCLVHAAAGGVGLLLCQLAKQKGARIIGTAGTEAKAQLAREAGADQVVVYTRDDFEAEARSGGGVDVVYDSVGKDTWERSLRCLRPRGMMVLFGQSSGPVPPIDPQQLSRQGSLFFTRPTLAHYTLTREELLGRTGELFALVRDKKLSVRIGETLPLAEASRAHQLLASRMTTGKVLLIP